MGSKYVPSYHFVGVFTGEKYSPDYPLHKIMQNPQQQRETAASPRTTRNLDLNSGPSMSTQVESSFVGIPNENYQSPRPAGRTYRRSRGSRFEEDQDLPNGIYQRSCPETMATVAMVVEQRRRGKEFKLGSERRLFDRTADGYKWLPSGWLCEERIMKSGRIYRYYCSPDGYLYYSKMDAIGVISRKKK